MVNKIILDYSKRVWTKTNAVIIGLFSLVAAISLFLINLDKIGNEIRVIKGVPVIRAKLSNSGKKAIFVMQRGGIIIGLPGSNNFSEIGAFEFIKANGKSISKNNFAVEPNDTLIAVAKLSNNKYIVPILYGGDYNICFVIYRAGDSKLITDDIAFTIDGIKNSCINEDVGRKGGFN
jgi:hypothetical protein